MLLAVALSSLTAVAQIPAAITSDSPADKADPAGMEAPAIPSHGAYVNAVVYVAQGAGPHPTVILLHGFPGNEMNLDLAQSIRRAGWNVIVFHYRGSWGSPGAFSFSNSIEDAQAVVAWVRDPQNAKKYRFDAQRIVLIGHSMGGFMAAAAGRDPKVAGIGMISGWNIGDNARHMSPSGLKDLVQGSLRPLSGCSADGLVEEMIAHKEEWDFTGFVPQLKDRPLLLVSADDGTLSSNEALATAMKSAGANRVTEVHLPTDHLFNDHRIALQIAVLEWLKTLNP
jgi:pimeloyl-ACP methyl ester carboxylesterase